MDIVGSGTALILLAPLLVLIAVIIKLTSKGPVFFEQERLGLFGKTFRFLKFRSMYVDNDPKIHQEFMKRLISGTHDAKSEGGSKLAYKMTNDPRVTRLGRWLRHTSIDELPQLFNVIQGNMSLVGPRPHAVAHNNQYEKMIANYAFRYHMKPGITGWAQINGYRGQTRTKDKMERRVEHDIWYINHWSPWLDIRILLKTSVLAYRQPTAY